MVLLPRLGLTGLLLLGACSVRSVALSGLSSSLARSATTFAREDDPELAREALPFALKAMEGVLLERPDDVGLLLATSAGFALYAHGFLEVDVERLAATDYDASEVLRARALALELRARDDALRALELAHPGIGARLRRTPAAAAAEIGAGEVEAAYLTGATWGLAIALGKDRADLVADVDAVRELLRRALALDERHGAGALHEALIPIEALPRAMGGSPERARAHFARAVELSVGNRASPYVALAESVCVPEQDRDEFRSLLEQALAVDLDAAPEQRLANRLAQARARVLLAKTDELFLPSE